MSGLVRRHPSRSLCGLLALFAAFGFGSSLAGCSDDPVDELPAPTPIEQQASTEDTGSAPATQTEPATQSADSTAGVRLISVEEAATMLFEDPPAGLVVLDLRTANEFNGRRLPGAVLFDYNGPDFDDRVRALDRDVPYLIYDRAGNRGASAREVMAELGFTDVADIDGGISAWTAAGYFG